MCPKRASGWKRVNKVDGRVWFPPMRTNAYVTNYLRCLRNSRRRESPTPRAMVNISTALEEIEDIPLRRPLLIFPRCCRHRRRSRRMSCVLGPVGARTTRTVSRLSVACFVGYQAAAIWCLLSKDEAPPTLNNSSEQSTQLT